MSNDPNLVETHTPKNVIKDDVKYRYRALDPKAQEIRILQVLPPSASRPEIVQCRIEHLSLQTPQKNLDYETISYAWGDQTAREAVEIDGQVVLVPASAALVLKSMRSWEQSQLFWIDAICIDQNNSQERAEQVNIMDQVYSRGKRNIVWLGVNDNTVQGAFNSINTILLNMKDETKAFRDIGRVLYDRRSFVLSKTGLPAFDSWAIQLFYSRPWFSRLWVMQEAALARESICYCGSLKIDLLDVLRVSAWLKHKRDQLDFDFGSHSGLSNAANMWDIVDRRYGQAAQRFGGPIRLQELLVLAERMDTTDPRDKVYGLLGLLKVVTKMDSPLDQLLRPDYDQPIAEVFKNAARFIVEQSRSLEFLARVWHRNSDDVSAPSWVPKWNEKLDFHQDASYLAYFFMADGGESVKLQETSKLPDQLILHGFRFDNVHRVTDPISKTLLDTEEGVQKIIREAFNMISSGSTHLHVQYTLIGGKNNEHEPAKHADVRDLDALVEHMNLERKLPPPVRNVDQFKDGAVYRASRYYQAMCHACRNRRVFVTSSGHIGIGPKIMLPQDIVVSAYGSKWPLVLRPNGTAGHVFIGLCYVRGIMFGEFVDTCKEQGRTIESFQVT